ncbi:hypothetical protein DSO57_1032943 [Entomophthora muscae]|uniref:Uncharacterized protein n=1 Tax=Entomophthora muscae TaxID=34485 RepID=A0ACC2T0D6_9FUNG|nr:hypothetical protein DSO57_1032943 [Entomophthora muscae]
MLKWRTLLPDPSAAGTFSWADFTPEDAAEWYDTGATAGEATIITQGGWNPATVINWLQSNNLKYGDINKFIHPTISPALAVEWKSHGFSATEAIQWANIAIQVDLARKLRNMKIHPSVVSDYLNSGYTIDESIEYMIKRTPLKSAPSPKTRDKTDNLLYSERVKKGLETELTKEGFIPFEDFIREHTAQGNPYKTAPRSSINFAICIYVNNLTKGSITQCKDAIYNALDSHFPDQQVDSYWSATDGYLDIGFDNAEMREEALALEIYHDGARLKIETTRYSKQRAKWVTFSNLPTNRDRDWVKEAILTGLSYYGEIKEVMVEGSNKAKCMRPKVIHALLDMAPIVKSRQTQLPRFIRLPGCTDTVTYVEPKSKRPVCRFCFQMGHTAFNCNHKKGVHHSEIDQDKTNGVTKVQKKVFLRPKPVWWLPTGVTDLLDMQAIQQSMATRHKEDHARVENLTNQDKTTDHIDPSTPVLVHIDEEPTVEERTIHPGYT